MSKEKKMGDVKNAVKGSGTSRPKKHATADAPKNILADLGRLQDEVADLAIIKDEDALTEGDAVRPENARKAAMLRAAHSLLTTCKTLLEDY